MHKGDAHGSLAAVLTGRGYKEFFAHGIDPLAEKNPQIQ
jgi:hypothetical protein